ncbi:hypothetical protein EGI24_19120 [Lacihabitans sp. CS3-21]|nr:hypothetical protein [Lacihabitans sp. CS3-21]
MRGASVASAPLSHRIWFLSATGSGSSRPPDMVPLSHRIWFLSATGYGSTQPPDLASLRHRIWLRLATIHVPTLDDLKYILVFS